MVLPRRVASALILPWLAAPVLAKTYCCNDDNGHRICGDELPPQCLTKAHQELNAQGVARQVEAPLTREQRLQREAELARKKDEDRKAAEDARQARALVAAYPSEKDIDAKRDRQLAEVEKARAEVQERYDAAMARKAKLGVEAEFYLKKPMPDDLKAKIKENEIDIAAQQAALDAKKQEMDGIRAKFAEDKRRYQEFRHGRPASPPAADPRPR